MQVVVKKPRIKIEGEIGDELVVCPPVGIGIHE